MTEANSALVPLIQIALRAVAAGNLDLLHTVLDADVRLEWADPGGLDCVGRDQLVEALRQSSTARQRFAETNRIETIADDVVVISSMTPAHDGSAGATRITVEAGRITRMQQFSSRDSAVRGPDPAQDAAVQAVRHGDVASLKSLLADNPGLARARLRNHGDRTLLHVATDWPGHYPDVAATIRALVAAGADVDAPSIGDHVETPLHWAASSDDVAALDALLDAGANIAARGAVIGNGTPLSDATAFGQWQTARRLVERGAHAEMWEAAALGLMPELTYYLDETNPTLEDITHSFWCACHGGQLEAGTTLLSHGADINWVGYDGLTPLGAAQRSEATADLVSWLKEHGAASAPPDR